MPKKKHHSPFIFKVFVVLPLVFLLIAFIVRLVSFKSYREFVSEDGILETLQFVFYFLTGCVLLNRFFVMLKEPKKWLLKSGLFLMAGIFLFISFEEISWGERILDYRNPDFFTVHNVQREVSVHNLVFIQPFIHFTYILLGIALGLVVPFLSKIAVFKKYRQYLFGWDLSLYFLPLSIVYLLLVIAPPVSLYGFSAYGLIWRDQEVVETLSAMGLFVWALKCGRQSTA